MAVYDEGFLAPLPPRLILPEMKEPKQWFAGHAWNDNVTTNKYLYSFVADAETGGLFYNTVMVNPKEIRSFDDYLKPKWKGRSAGAIPHWRIRPIDLVLALGGQRRGIPQADGETGSVHHP